MDAQRKDTWTAMIITMALRMQRLQGCRFMAHNAVPLRVAKRVMLKPDQRRAVA